MNFEHAFENVLLKEKGYADHPNDKGGETYDGISRKHNKNWEGWEIIDEYKTKENFPANLETNADLQSKVKKFYKENEWDVLNLDEFPYMIAEELLDIGTNFGKTKAVEFLQRSINLLNVKQRHWNNIKVDGKLGAITMAAVKACLGKLGTQKLFNMLNLYQGKAYIEIMEKDESQEIWVGWFDRVNFVNKNRT